MKRFLSILSGVALIVSLFSGCKEKEPEPEKVDLNAPVITAIADGNAVVVSWKTVTNATGYKVEFKKADAAEFTMAGTASYSPYRVTGLDYGNTYEFRVKATCGESESEYSNVASVGVFNLLPKTTVSLNAGITFIDVEWEAVEGAASYQVEHKITASSEYTVDFTVAAADIDNLHRITNLQSGVSYDVRVGAIAEGYSMSYSDPATVATTEAPSTLIETGAQLVSWLGSINNGYTDVAALANDIDMQGLTITSASGFAGTLEGQGFAIKNLVSSVPLFAENSGAIKNLTLDESCAFTPSTKVFGALVAMDNGGSYTSISTAASITYTATSNIEENFVIGGLVGVSNSEAVSRFTSCSNSGAITLNAAGYTHWAVAIGGIIGYTKQSVFESCTNDGAISLSALYADNFHQWSFVTEATADPDGNTCIGGIVGKAWDINTDYESTFNQCENLEGGIITVSHTAFNTLANDTRDYGCVNVGGICGQGNGTIQKNHNRATINVSVSATDVDYYKRQNNLVHVGGIVGKSYRGMSISSSSNRAPINVAYDGSWDEKIRYMSAVGGICGSEGYNSSTSRIYYSTNHGPITVTGEGTLCVGGICGALSYQRGNKVYNTATIIANIRKGYVGGLMGGSEGGASSTGIKSSWCEADITTKSSLSDRYSISTGGLIGCNLIGNATDLLTSQESEGACHYYGNIVSTGQIKVGMAVGWDYASGKEHIYGSEDYKIKLSGSIHRWGFNADTEMAEPQTITSSNVMDFAIGTIKETTVTIYAECPSTTE